MVTTNSPSISPSPVEKIPELEAADKPEESVAGEMQPKPDGFLSLLIQSIFEPGANAAVVMAMNISFFLLLLTLFGLAAITQWNKHVIFMLFFSAALWAAMVWFVMEITRVKANPENLPPADPLVAASTEGTGDESRKDQ